MTDSRSGEKSLREVDLNIHLYLTLNCGMASEHLKYSNKIKLENKLYDVFVAFVGLNIRKNSVYAEYRIWISLVCPIPDPAGNASIGAILILNIRSAHPMLPVGSLCFILT